jgi:hypothetical protein
MDSFLAARMPTLCKSQAVNLSATRRRNVRFDWVVCRNLRQLRNSVMLLCLGSRSNEVKYQPETRQHRKRLAVFRVVAGAFFRPKPETGNKVPSQVIADQYCNLLPITIIFMQHTYMAHIATVTGPTLKLHQAGNSEPVSTSLHATHIGSAFSGRKCHPAVQSIVSILRVSRFLAANHRSESFRHAHADQMILAAQI